jgi:hypothetical protein
MVTLVKLLHLLNASLPILVTLLGMVTLVKLLHLLNAEFSIFVMLLGMVSSPVISMPFI